MLYDKLSSDKNINIAVTELGKHGVEGLIVNTKEDALAKIKELIPLGASVMNGSSTTLEQIGYVDYLKSGKHGWNNLHEAIIKEVDPTKQSELRQQAIHAEYYLGSAHALSESGELVIASATGSQLPHIAFTSKNLIFVVGAQKIVPNLGEALKRLAEYVMPLEDEQSKKKWGVGTADNKILIFKGESPMMGRKVRVIIVKESLGF